MQCLKLKAVKGVEHHSEKKYYLLMIMFMLGFSANPVSFIYLLFYLLDISPMATHFV